MLSLPRDLRPTVNGRTTKLNAAFALGGITLCNRSGHRLDDRYANLHMAPGCHEMNGVQALAFVRARHVDSDFGRIGRQQEFMRASWPRWPVGAACPACPG